MFGDKKSRKDSERSLISETVSIDGVVNSSGAIDIAGLIKGPVISKEVVIKDMKRKFVVSALDPDSNTHLTLPTNRDV